MPGLPQLPRCIARYCPTAGSLRGMVQYEQVYFEGGIFFIFAS